MADKVEDRCLIDLFLKKGVLEPCPGRPNSHYSLPLLDFPGQELRQLNVRKDAIQNLVEGNIAEIKIQVHQEIKRRSLYGDETVDTKFYDGGATVTFDRAKLVFDVSVSGHSYWDTKGHGFF